MSLPAQAYRPPLEPGARPRLPVAAGFARRAWALALDDLVAAGPILAAAINARVVYGPTMSPDDSGAAGVVALLASLWIPVGWFLNRLVLTSRTGRSVGKAVVGIRIVYIPTWEPPTISQLFHREIQHGADSGLFSRGWQRVDTHWLGQTYADELSHTAVIRSNPPDVWDESDPHGWGA